MASECGAGNDAVNGAKGNAGPGPGPAVASRRGRRRCGTGLRRAGRCVSHASLPARAAGVRSGAGACRSRVRGCGGRPRRAGGRAGRRRGRRAWLFLVPRSVYLGWVPRVRRRAGAGGRPGPSAAQDHGTPGGRRHRRGGGRSESGAGVWAMTVEVEVEVAVVRCGRWCRGGASAAARGGAQGGVEMVVLTGGAAGPAPGGRRSDRRGRGGLGGRVRAGHRQGEQQDEDPQPGTPARDARGASGGGGVRCGAHVRSCPRRAYAAHRAGDRNRPLGVRTVREPFTACAVPGGRVRAGAGR